MDRATKSILKCLLRVIKYLIDTKVKKLQYFLKKETVEELVIEGFGNCNYAENKG
jgi:hypothetical protein